MRQIPFIALVNKHLMPKRYKIKESDIGRNIDSSYGNVIKSDVGRTLILVEINKFNERSYLFYMD